MPTAKHLVLDNLSRLLSAASRRLLTDIDDARQREAVTSTARYINDHLPGATTIRAATVGEVREQLIALGLQLSLPTGLTLEFGVASGETLRQIASRRLPVHGFDSFEGLPQHWRTGFEEGRFAQEAPDVGGAELHVGWFHDTWPKFLAENPGPIAFVHMDADLYSSTATIFEAEDRFVEGSILLFDEYFNFPSWEQHEHKAFVEFLQRTGRACEYVAYAGQYEQLLVRLGPTKHSLL